MGERLAAVAGAGVGHERDAADLEAGPAGGDALEDRGHADRVAAQPGAAAGPRPGSRTVGPSQARRRCPPQARRPRPRRRRAGARAEPRAPGIGQVREARPDRVGVRSDSGFRPVRLMWSRDDHQRARAERRVEAAGRVRQDDDPRARAARTAAPAGRRGPGRCPRTGGSRPWSMTTGRPVEAAEEQPAGVTRRRRGRPAGQVRERDRDGVLELVGEAAETRPEDDPELRARGRSGARTAASSASRRAGWSAGGIGCRTGPSVRRCRDVSGPPG